MEIKQSLAAYYGPSKFPLRPKGSFHVANVSPREARLWCQLNTT